MSTEPSIQPKYLYAITRTGALKEAALHGIEDEPIFTIDEGPLAVIVSALSTLRIRPRRRHLKAHHDLINTLAARELDLLPMAFGSVAESAAQLRRFLRDHHDELVYKIEQLGGRVEVQVRVAWKVNDIFQHFVKQHDELRAVRDEYFQDGGREPTRQEKMHLGELFIDLLETERQAHRATVEEHVGAVSDQLHADECRDESEVMRLACLVQRDRIDELEAAIYDAAAQFDDHFVFNYTDRTAPYTFAQVEL